MPYGKTSPVGATCTVCNKLNYIRRRNKATEKTELLKFCNKCRKSTPHKAKGIRHSN